MINTELDQSESKDDCHEFFETFEILLNNTFTDGFLSATVSGWTRKIGSDLFVVGGVGCGRGRANCYTIRRQVERS